MSLVLYLLVLWILVSVPVALFAGRMCSLNRLPVDDFLDTNITVEKPAVRRETSVAAHQPLVGYSAVRIESAINCSN